MRRIFAHNKQIILTKIYTLCMIPHLKNVAFYTVQISFLVNAVPGLLISAYAISIAEERQPAANEFKEKSK
jgi:hypothetical protein